jgi:transcriptional regulator of aromatic amino acid metabolism
VAYEQLPQLASAADGLVMPYADIEVTRAMQPLKFKEYLATGKPVLARDLPAMRSWSDATDLMRSASDFVQRAMQRLTTGTPPEQQAARQRLIHESWSEKARQFELTLAGEPIHKDG